jgi:hypothetical protein
VAQPMYTHVSKRKNDKIREIKKKTENHRQMGFCQGSFCKAEEIVNIKGQHTEQEKDFQIIHLI